MSRYGASGGPAPPEGPPGGYDAPSDPWGDVASWEPAAAPPGYDAHPPAPDWSSAPPPPSPRRHLGLSIALGLAVLVAAGGVATAAYLISGDDRPTVRPTPSGGGEGGGTTPAPPTSTPNNLGLAAGFAQVGDCLVNDGTDDTPQMRITACDAEGEQIVYRVLARFDERVADDNGARQVCGSTAGYRYHYYFISEGDGASFVLCMTDRL